jgi:hypothetical protein
MAYKKQWIENNREKVKVTTRARYAANQERERAYQRQYYAENRARILDRLRAENTDPEKQEQRRETWRKYSARPERKEARKLIDARPEHVLRRRNFAQTPQARKAARDVMERRYQEDPSIRTRVAEYNRFTRTGFTAEMIERLLAEQSSACAICRRTFTSKVIMHADHCHATKKTRGLLCLQCNVIEGKLLAIGLSPLQFGQLLHDYLEKYQ